MCHYNYLNIIYIFYACLCISINYYLQHHKAFFYEDRYNNINSDTHYFTLERTLIKLMIIITTNFSRLNTTVLWFFCLVEVVKPLMIIIN